MFTLSRDPLAVDTTARAAEGRMAAGTSATASIKKLLFVPITSTSLCSSMRNMPAGLAGSGDSGAAAEAAEAGKKGKKGATYRFQSQLPKLQVNWSTLEKPANWVAKNGGAEMFTHKFSFQVLQCTLPIGAEVECSVIGGNSLDQCSGPLGNVKPAGRRDLGTLKKKSINASDYVHTTLRAGPARYEYDSVEDQTVKCGEARTYRFAASVHFAVQFAALTTGITCWKE